MLYRSLKVSLFKKERLPDPLEEVLTKVNSGNTLVLRNVPPDTKDDHLILFLESSCNLKRDDFHLCHLKESSLILMTLVDSVKGEHLDFEIIIIQSLTSIPQYYITTLCKVASTVAPWNIDIAEYVIQKQNYCNTNSRTNIITMNYHQKCAEIPQTLCLISLYIIASDILVHTSSSIM